MKKAEKKAENIAIEAEEKSKQESAGPRWYRPLLIFLIIVIIGSSALLIYHGTTGYYPWDTRSSSTFTGGMDDGQILKALQEATDKSAFQFRINSRPVFADSAAEGPLFIENPEENRYLMRVTIRLKETGETVYQTKAIKPGYGIGRDKLRKKLSPGEHEAVAIITALDPETGKTAGSAQAEIKLIMEQEGEE